MTTKNPLLDHDGKTSTMRVAMLLFAGCVFVTWSVISIKEGYMIDINPQVKEILMYLLLGKVGQSYAEAWKAQPIKSVAPGKPTVE